MAGKEFIEREALLKDILESVVFSVKEGQPSLEIRGANKITDRIKAAPAADVVEVRHGKWIKGRKEKLYYNYDMSGFYDFPVTCSVCKFDITDEGFYETNYCPNCGAKMDGKDIDVTTKTDQVEVVRCKDCRYGNPYLHYFYCDNNNAPWSENTMANIMDANDFCSYGERKCEDG